ncbi:serine hydrolase domain-containing protein [Paenibacillus sp.]|uniref:serine hydrolase domain-containing protein n=1 Tax=Paenibacillus sp. TaxID=58172 RepID=UPI00281241CE|nr:serine hydrolase domain-containing protein [Paenibacillus sp.]
MNIFGKVTQVCLALVMAALPAANAYADREGDPLDASTLDKIETYVKEQFVIAGIPGGSYAIVDRGNIVRSAGIGYADLETRREATPETVYATASVTKPFTAAAVLRLAEQRVVDLDAPVVSYLPWFRYEDRSASSRVTVRHLLTHSAGVSRYSADGAIYQDVENNRNSMEGAARALRTVKMNAAPGARGQYCNTCFNVLGLIVEEVTGKPYEEYMRESLFEPLGMDDASFRPSEAANADVAKEYGYMFGFATEVTPYWKEFGSSQAPEGGAYGSATDLARFAAAALGYGADPFFASGTLDAYHNAGVPASDLLNAVYTESGFEASELHGTRVLAKSGDGMGSSSEIILIPRMGAGLVLFVGEADGEACGRIAKGIASLMLGRPPASVDGMPNALQVVGQVSLGILILSGILAIWLVGSVIRHRRRGYAARRRWAVALRAAIYAIFSVPVWYLLLAFRPTEAGFYGYPYDFAIAMIAIVVPLTLWAAYSAALLAFGRQEHLVKEAERQ